LPHLLFVYGSLRDADVRRHVLGASADRLATTTVTAPGYRVLAWPPRSYPAIVAAPGALARGLLIGGLAAGDLARLDRFEGNEYVRRPIELIVTGRLIGADVYWPSLPVAPAADWSLADWTLRHKAAFLAAEGGRHA